jgi:hypothetical protein
MKRKPLSDKSSKKIFSSGNYVKDRNVAPPPMRGGYRL